MTDFQLVARPGHRIMFAVTDVPVAATLLEVAPYRETVEIHLARTVEACSEQTRSLIPVRAHPLVCAVHYAFAQHYPLVITPDHLWLLICQGFAQHVNQNAEDLRPLLVEHQGKQTLEVIRRNFKKGAPDNPWPEALEEFRQQLQTHLRADVFDLLNATFTTTGRTGQLAFTISLMDTVQGYFDYRVSLCGIPAITLEGSPDDWRSVLDRTRQLAAFGLEWWVNALVPVLEELVRTSEGQINRAFWESLYKFKSESGGPFITGWILKFFPYLETVILDSNRGRVKTLERNPGLLLEDSGSGADLEISLGDTGSGLSNAPFMWECREGEYAMEFTAGFIGIAQDRTTKALRAEIGWAVSDAQSGK